MVCYFKVYVFLFSSKTRYVEIHNLKPNTWYEFKVRGFNDKKVASSFSHSLQVQTESDGKVFL